jgi:hypothetical protein
MDAKNTEDYVIWVLQTHLKFGIINRVDFTPINKKKGFAETESDSMLYKSAFVHFSHIWNDIYSQDKNGRKFWDTIEKNMPYKVNLVLENEYWICLKNKNPVSSTMMNVHQVVENGRYLENLIVEQGKQLKEQAQEINDLKILLESFLQVKNITQDDEVEDNNLCLRKRLAQINKYKKVYDYDEDELDDDDCSMTTHSSILPEVEYFDFETESNETSERIKNSCDLCGNE